jgi:hypothetical protein
MPDASFAQVRADIAAEAPRDALIDAQAELADLQARFADLRGLRKETAELLFGSEACWRLSLARQGVAIGRSLSACSALRRAAGLEPDFSLDEIATPLAPGMGISGVRRTGD